MFTRRADVRLRRPRTPQQSALTGRSAGELATLRVGQRPGRQLRQGRDVDPTVRLRRAGRCERHAVRKRQGRLVEPDGVRRTGLVDRHEPVRGRRHDHQAEAVAARDDRVIGCQLDRDPVPAGALEASPAPGQSLQWSGADPSDDVAVAPVVVPDLAPEARGRCAGRRRGARRSDLGGRLRWRA